MRRETLRFLMVLAACAWLTPDARATDGDGPDDCQRPNPPVDFGDAPEGVLAYPGVTGEFPTCKAAGALPGTRTVACPPISTAPGLTGYVQHVHPAADRYWLGCGPVALPPLGIDSEADGKVNDTGAPASACNNAVTVDCTETVGLMTFGQDECYGSSDAALASPVQFKACGPGNVGWTISAHSCATVTRQVYLQVLVDWNQDGDWNDNFQCSTGCAYEWPVKNFLVALAPGCNTIYPPTFRAGPNPGRGWMRITISDEQVPDDFPWNGSVGTPTQTLHNGETEDYPVAILPSASCPSYEDWGDAPEEVQAYPGVPGHFPTCSQPGSPGTPEWDCAPRSTPPGPTGYVRHVATATDNFSFWLGCPNATGSIGVDSETDGKTNDNGLPTSACSPNVAVDCLEPAILTYGQDECYGDGVDAGLDGPWLSFNVCQPGFVRFRTYNCQDVPREVFLNVLMDMNHDGDWNDNFLCVGQGCAYEWGVKNQLVTLNPGCELHLSPQFLAGPNAGQGWLRITLTSAPVSDDFPWDGSAGPNGNGFFSGGETEDYLAVIRPNNVGVEDPGTGPSRLALAPIAPNPSMDRVQIWFTLPQAADASLAAYDISGRKVAELMHGRLEAGEHQVSWSFTDQGGRSLPAGQYVIKLRVGDRAITRRAIRVR